MSYTACTELDLFVEILYNPTQSVVNIMYSTKTSITVCLSSLITHSRVAKSSTTPSHIVLIVVSCMYCRQYHNGLVLVHSKSIIFGTITII